MEQIDEIERLIDQLNDKSDDVCLAAVQSLVAIGEPAVLPLIEALKAECSWEVYDYAMLALGYIKDARAVPALVEMFKNHDWFLRASALQALGKIGEPAVPAITEALKDGNKEVRFQTYKLLARIGDAHAIPALKEALKNKSEDEYRFIGEVIKRIEGVPDFSFIKAEPLLKREDEEVCDSAFALIEDIKESSWVRQQAIIQDLVHIGKPAVPALIGALQDVDKEVRRTVVEVLGKIRDERATPALIKTLENKNSGRYVRRAAIDALWRMVNDSNITDIIKATSDAEADSDPSVRKKAKKWMEVVRMLEEYAQAQIEPNA